MCLPTDSTFICSADRRIAIITAYHSSCAGISDIIRLLVHHSVTVSTSLLDTVGDNLQIGSLCFCGGDLSNLAQGGKKVRRLFLCVWHGEVQFRTLAICECIIACRQQQITKHLPSVHIQPLLVSAVHIWLFHIDVASAHIPGGWQLSAAPTLTTSTLPHLFFLPPQSHNCLALIRNLAEQDGTFQGNSTQRRRRLWHEEMWACVCAYVCVCVTSLTSATNHSTITARPYIWEVKDLGAF